MALKLLAGIDETSNPKTSVMSRYSLIFQGLGNLGEPYKIKLKPDAKPHSLFTARNAPLPLRDKVKDELNRMESIGVISKVEQPVVVPKKNKAIRICVDLKADMAYLKLS